MRGLGYTNDIGVAINEIAPKTATLFWVPALMYFGADVYDKYKIKVINTTLMLNVHFLKLYFNLLQVLFCRQCLGI